MFFALLLLTLHHPTLGAPLSTDPHARQLVLPTDHSADPGLACTASTSTTLDVLWREVDATDLYYVAVSLGVESKPFLVHTAQGTSITLEDLLPNTSYWLRVRSHPSSEPSIAYGPSWRPYSPPVICTTRPTPPGAPHSLVRVGGPSTSAITIQWTSPSQQQQQAAEVGLREHGEEAWSWSAAASPHSHTFDHLTPATSFDIAVRTGGMTSDPVVFRTAVPGKNYTTMYRLSEFSFDVDFLENHNSASIEAMPLYLMTCTPGGMCTPMNTSSYAKNWTQCQEAMQSICGGLQGTAFKCMDCAKANNASVTKACGKWEYADTLVGFAVHWYCGVGWPESVLMDSPITEYCVEHDGSGPPAQYSSCNSDECDPHGSTPRDPICVCWVYDDRMLSLQEKDIIDATCTRPIEPFVDEVQCNCSHSDPSIPPWSVEGTREATFVGVSSMYLPYNYYKSPL
eukprot:Sspe_Gene.21737::Locus_8176_Transcript_1_1_Confidence_1.000_Length_1423::g.21737::m.21737